MESKVIKLIPDHKKYPRQVRNQSEPVREFLLSCGLVGIVGAACISYISRSI